MGLARMDWMMVPTSVSTCKTLAHLTRILISFTIPNFLVMSNWNGTIIGPGHSVHQNRIYSLKIHCSESYPDTPPLIWFLTRINLPCVNSQTGKVSRNNQFRRGLAKAAFQVESNLLPVLAHWKRQYTLETVLIELRK